RGNPPYPGSAFGGGKPVRTTRPQPRAVVMARVARMKRAPAVTRYRGRGDRRRSARSITFATRSGDAAIIAIGPSYAPAVRVATPAMNSAYGPSPPRSAAVDTAVSPNFVLIRPGSITDTRTPNGLTSYRRASLIASTACLLAWYAPAPGNVSRPPMELTLAIRPHRWRRIPGSASWVRWIMPNRLVSNWRRHSSSGTSSTGPPRLKPALLTSAPTAPSA